MNGLLRIMPLWRGTFQASGKVIWLSGKSLIDLSDAQPCH